MTYKIPLFDLNFGKEEIDAISETLRSKWISMGSKVRQFEELFADHLSINYAVALSSCTAALHLALKVLGIGRDDEVILPSLTFIATVNAVRYVDATPVLADISSFEDFSISPEDIEKKITPRTRAIIVMHYGGFACEIDKIKEIARKYNLKVIEDAAHSPDSEYKGRKLGSIGDIGCFSFFSNKNITCAEGGILATNNEEFAKKVELLRSHGMTSLSFDRAKGDVVEYDVIASGYNYRMDDIRGALLLAQFKRLKEDIAKREKLRKFYIEELKHFNEIIVPYKNHPYRSSNYIFPIVLKNSNVKKRNVVRYKLAKLGIETSVHYPAVHKFSIFKGVNVVLPKTEYVADNEISLPLYFNLHEGQISEILEKLATILEDMKNERY